MAGFKSRSTPHDSLYSKKISIPTLHVFGETDKVIPKGQKITAWHTFLQSINFIAAHFDISLPLTKSGHPTPSHPSNHHLKLIFFSSPTDCVCGGGEKESGGEGERGGREMGEGERELVVCRKVWAFFFSPLILFHVKGLVLQRRNNTEKNTLLSLLYYY